MGYGKLNIVLSFLCLAIWLPIAVVFLLMNTIIGYFMSAVFFGFSCYVIYYVYRIRWLSNADRHLSAENKRKIEQYQRQIHDYQTYNMYNRLYRFADATKAEYEAEKVKKELRKTRHRS